ncbi:hypothetical protein F4824DRAFT_462851 [Ustulina deusta]|nr:hypothetical protein F4824DRAFT_462851 [Ustulina deusta]
MHVHLRHLCEICVVWAAGREALAGVLLVSVLFSGPLGHSYMDFRQTALLYEEAAEESDFDALCTIVASAVYVHPEFLALLRLIVGKPPSRSEV